VNGLNEKQRQDAAAMIHKAVNSALGDMAEYLNYLNDRLEIIEAKVGIEPPAEFAGEIAARYGFPDGKRKETVSTEEG